MCVQAKSLQLHPTLCNPMDCSLPGFSVHGIPQARILEQKIPWIFLSQRSNLCLLCPLHWQAGSLPLAPSGKPTNSMELKNTKHFSKPYRERQISYDITHMCNLLKMTYLQNRNTLRDFKNKSIITTGERWW